MYIFKKKKKTEDSEAVGSSVCISLTPACLTKNPGQADEEHHTPDIQHASYLENRKMHCSVNRLHASRSLVSQCTPLSSFSALCASRWKSCLAPESLSAGRSDTTATWILQSTKYPRTHQDTPDPAKLYSLFFFVNGTCGFQIIWRGPNAPLAVILHGAGQRDVSTLWRTKHTLMYCLGQKWWVSAFGLRQASKLY